MKNLLKKFRENKKGFTLAELLVVVAIVGILIAISIPVFTAQLGKAREATNQANLRAAKAAAVAQYLTDGKDETETYVYNISEGTATKGDITGGNTVTIEGVDGSTKLTEISVTITVDANDKSKTTITFKAK